MKEKTRGKEEEKIIDITQLENTTTTEKTELQPKLDAQEEEPQQ